MAENESFFRKVVRFVANPATDWTDLSSRTEDGAELELEKSELKAMIERKRRNDFVRKREFDMLRRVRREGLSPEQLAALGSSSRLDDSEVNRAHDGPPSRSSGVKAKIDAIEQQMVGEPGFGAPPSSAGPSTRSPGDRDSRRHALREAPTAPAAFSGPATSIPGDVGPSGLSRASAYEEEAALLRSVTPQKSRPRLVASMETDVRQSGWSAKLPETTPASVAPGQGKGLPPLAPMAAMSFEGAHADQDQATELSRGSAVEISEVVHDPALDEAVISFANADFGACEEALQRITGSRGLRAHHAETWLVLFDLYRATGQQQRFESLALEYAQRFGWSAPQWYSIPQMVADAEADAPDITSRLSTDRPSGAGWICPQHLDTEAVTRLRAQTLQLPMPWVLDWNALETIDAEAAMQLSALLRLWAGQPVEMRWDGGERLFTGLQEAAPTGMRDADPVFWLTRMDALRLANRAAHFDEVAIDYCVTYEVSPPSWESPRAKVAISGDDGRSSRLPSVAAVSELPASFMESGMVEDAISGQETATVELSGQLVGDISATLARMQLSLGKAQLVRISCQRLIRVDFIAAGDLLNWVLSRLQEDRSVHFVDTHRLVALFFGAMGINEHAKVQVRKV